MTIEHSRSNGTTEFVLLSQGKKAIAEFEIDGCKAEMAVDGREETCWKGGPYYKWWKLDLEKVLPLSRIRISVYAGDERYVHYFVEASQDGLNWTEIASKKDDAVATLDGVWHETSAAARYIRVTVTYCSTDEAALLRHVEVYGSDDPLEMEAPPRKASLLFPATEWDEGEGFGLREDDELEPGRRAVVAASDQAGAYLLYRDVDFTAQGVNQLRGEFGFANPDKSLKANLEVRLGGPEGVVIGELVLFKQWKRWSILAGELFSSDNQPLNGVHDVCLILKSIDPGQTLLIHWLALAQATAFPAPRPRPADLPAPNGEYRVYFGNLHSHTGFSDGIGVPEYAYDYARYTAELDFLAITEHSNLYDHYLDWDKSRKWREIQEIAEAKTEEDTFLALYGAETTWYNQFGHMNTYNMDFFINAYETKFNDIPTYYELVKRYPDSIQQWNHPWSCGNRHLDGFAPYDPELDKVMHMLEINTIESKELGGLYYYVKALDLGWHIAPVGSQDNHHGQWGTENTLRTGVLVDRLTEEHFFDAVRRQRVYFTSALFLQVWFRVNGAIMGSRISETEMLSFDIVASYRRETGQRIVRAEIIGEQGIVLHSVECKELELRLQFELPSGQRYYFVKVYQEDGEFAATAPVWVE